MPNPNVEMCARFLRQRVPGSENAAGRAERLASWAKIESTREGREVEALRWAEAAVQRAPWDSASRRVLQALQSAYRDADVQG